MLAAILHLGNVTFKPKNPDGEAVVVANEDGKICYFT
jgi:hypothetical protein